MNLNKRDGGNRKFVLVEMDKEICSAVAAERLRRVVSGYSKGNGVQERIKGLGGGFRYCDLGTELFNEYGDVSMEVRYPDLAAHIFFSETGVPIPHKAEDGNAFLGTHQGKAVYLLFSQANMGKPRAAAGNVLTVDALASLPPVPEGFDGQRIVYAEGCTVSPERLKTEGVIFKQIPYQVEGA